jgi:hypothetical protein
MMLEFLGHKDAHDAVLAAIEKVLIPKAVRRARRHRRHRRHGRPGQIAIAMIPRCRRGKREKIAPARGTARLRCTGGCG